MPSARPSSSTLPIRQHAPTITSPPSAKACASPATRRRCRRPSSLQTPDGVAIPPANADLSTSGSLGGGQQLEGKVAFLVGERSGDFFVLYRPDVFDKGRGVWKVTR
jgi:hypothetical protein